MIKAQEIKRIAKFALFGAVGFGVGGAVAGGIQQAISSPWEMFSTFVVFITVPVWGAIAGLVLGLAFWDWGRVIALSLLGANGLLAGGYIGYLVVHGAKPPEEVGWIAWFGVTSIVLACVLGFGIWGDSLNWRKILVLALAGALGFGLGAYIIGHHYYDNVLDSLILMGWRGLSWMWVGIIGGASVGATLGFLEKGREKREPPKEAKPEETPPEAVTPKEPIA